MYFVGSAEEKNQDRFGSKNKQNKTYWSQLQSVVTDNLCNQVVWGKIDGKTYMHAFQLYNLVYFNLSTVTYF